MKTPPKLRTIKAQDLLTTLSADEIKIINSYRVMGEKDRILFFKLSHHMGARCSAEVRRTTPFKLILGGRQ